MKRFKGLVAALAMAGGLGLASAAHAAPGAPLPADALAGASAERVAFGCGPGFTVNRFGRCVRIFRPYGFYRPRPYFRPRVYGPRRFYGGPRGFYRRRW